MTRWRRPLLIGLLTVVLLVALVYGVRWWRFSRTHVSTDDAYVHADVAQVTARVPGTIVALAVEDNTHVEQGDPLLKLDREEFDIRLREAEAAVAQAVRSVEELKAAVQSAESRLTMAQAEYSQLRLDHARAEQLAGRDVVPKERLDRARTALRAGEARVQTAKSEVERARAALGVGLDAPPERTAVVRQAIAARDAAALNVSYTDIRAPITGVVARRAIEVGQRIQPGQPLMMIVPLGRVYVEANFKETQLERVRVGQPAELVADIYPNLVFRGHVESVSPGSGAAFAMLPPENASGNWVKVVQRVPVRIALDEPPPADRPLPIAVSVEATIDVAAPARPERRATASAQ